MLSYIKNKIKNFLSSFLKDYENSLSDEYKMSLSDKILDINSRLRYLESENANISNELYEIENRLQSQIDKISPPTMDLKNFSLGE